MGQTFSIAIDMSGLLQISPLIHEQIAEQLHTAVENIAQAGVERWKRAVLGEPKLWEGERTAYAETIRYVMDGPYAANIVSDYKYVEDIETGRAAYDMKQMLDTSLKTRISKKGKKYLIIPFRHNTPGNTALAAAMPASVYAVAKKLKASKVIGHGTRFSENSNDYYNIATVRTRKYLWGGKLPGMQGPKLRGDKKTDRYAGMYRFKEVTGGSTYLTFRTMVEGSPGWIRPAQPGRYIAKAVAESLQRSADSEFGQAAVDAAS